MGMGYWGWGNIMAGGPGGMWLFTLLHIFTHFLFCAIVIAVGFHLVKTLKKNQTSSNDSNDNISALDILKLRYAKGEISEAEFDRMKNKL